MLPFPEGLLRRVDPPDVLELVVESRALHTTSADDLHRPDSRACVIAVLRAVKVHKLDVIEEQAVV